jgi:hypothetical protein
VFPDILPSAVSICVAATDRRSQVFRLWSTGLVLTL